MKESIYKKYCEQKLPKKIQKRTEGFASVADTVQEEMFRAGFFCEIHLDEISPKIGNDFIVVAKEDFTLDWFCKTRKALRKKQL